MYAIIVGKSHTATQLALYEKLHMHPCSTDFMPAVTDVGYHILQDNTSHHTSVIEQRII
jgi:hypothetical protein